jgi:heavy metal translocating P-type ATPase
MTKVLDRYLVLVPAAGLVAGFVLRMLGEESLTQGVWLGATAVVLLALLVQVVRSLLRGEVGLDLVAALSMAGAIVLGEALAGIVVALMYSGGLFLESYAQGRAQRELTALLRRAPRSAMRLAEGGAVEVAVDDIVPGDRLLVRHGEVLATDGTPEAGEALLDRSALTGESVPVPCPAGGEALSGTLNVGPSFVLVASRPAAASTYAGIIRLVRATQAAKAPLGRLADRYAVWFFFVTVALAAAAGFLSGDPVRALAVLVVATPCPLILAVPIALIAGVSRAAKSGVLVKGSGALEHLARAKVAVLDKTGTVTLGRADLVRIDIAAGFDEGELLRLAAALDQASTHVLAEALVEAARKRRLDLPAPTEVREAPGTGIEGVVAGRDVALGGRTYVGQRVRAGQAMPDDDRTGLAVIFVAVDGDFAGTLAFADRLRPEARQAIADLRRNGMERIVLASGDTRDIAERIGTAIGVDAVHADLTPEQKVALIAAERVHGPVLMIGDGVNDAPALAAADVGVAMGARGAAAASETADAVVLVDRLDRPVEAVAIARRSLALALGSARLGLGLSLAAMCFAAFGYLPPVQGALLQEAIDVLVILNALRALGPPAPLVPAKAGTQLSGPIVSKAGSPLSRG